MIGKRFSYRSRDNRIGIAGATDTGVSSPGPFARSDWLRRRTHRRIRRRAPQCPADVRGEVTPVDRHAYLHAYVSLGYLCRRSLLRSVHADSLF